MRNRLFVRKVKLPSNITLSRSSRSAGTRVTSVRKLKSTASLPRMYSDRINGFDR
jgi:hypothetical protein